MHEILTWLSNAVDSALWMIGKRKERDIRNAEENLKSAGSLLKEAFHEARRQIAYDTPFSNN